MTANVVYEPYRKVPLTEFHDELLFEFPKLPLQLFDYYIMNTAVAMARDGKLIRRNGKLYAKACVTRYLLEAPDGMDICAVLSISGRSCCTGRQRVRRTITRPDTSHDSLHEYAWYDDIEHILTIESPSKNEVYSIQLAVTPRRSDCELPEPYRDELFDTLMMGTKGRILMIPDRPWTDVQTGMQFYNEFKRRIVSHDFETSLHKQRGMIQMNFGGRVL